MSNTFGDTVNNGYIQFPVNTDSTQLYQDALTAIATSLPGWVPVEGHIEVLLLEQMAAMVAEGANVAALVPQGIFAYFGALIGIAPRTGVAAEANTTWTMVDAQGYTVPAGTPVGYQVLGNQLFSFQTVESFTVPGPSVGRVLASAVITAASDTLFCSTANFTTAGDVGRTVNDAHGTTNIPAGTVIQSVSSPTTAIMSQLANATPGPESITLGGIAGQTQTTPGAVTIQALAVGENFNGLPPQTLTLQSALGFVSTIQSTTTTAGGENAESTQQYLDRLSQELQLLAPRPILPNDFAVLAVQTPAVDVFRAGAINGLNPFSNSFDQSDSEFTPTIGSWTNVTGCTASAHLGAQGENALRLTASATTASDRTMSYSVAQNQPYLAMISVDEPSAITSETMTLSVDFFDVNGSSLSSVASFPIIPSSTGLSIAFTQFTTPSGTSTVTLGITVNNSVSTRHYDFAFAQLSLFSGGQLLNFVPDSSLQAVSEALTWAITNSQEIVPIDTNVNGVQYTGNGFPSGTITTTSNFFYLPAGLYSVSGLIDATNVLSGTPEITISDSGGVICTLGQTAGDIGQVSSSFSIGSAQMCFVTFTTNNCIVQSGLTLTWAEPQVTTGSGLLPYQQGPTWTPPNEVFNQERMITVVPLNDTGTALLPSEQAAVAAYLESLREVNFVVNVISPSYSGIDITWSGVAAEGFNSNTVLSDVNAALQSYLSPENWAGGTDTPPSWDLSQTIVRYLSIATIIGETTGLKYITSLAIGLHNQTSLGTSDITLPGFAPLPQPGTIAGTVN